MRVVLIVIIVACAQDGCAHRAVAEGAGGEGENRK